MSDRMCEYEEERHARTRHTRTGGAATSNVEMHGTPGCLCVFVLFGLFRLTGSLKRRMLANDGPTPHNLLHERTKVKASDWPVPSAGQRQNETGTIVV